MRFHVEPWAPEYGAAAEDAAFATSDATVNAAVELAEDRWRPLTSTSPPASDVAFVDGVRRIDAHVWISENDSAGNPVVHHGICVSYGAGVVRSNGRAALDAAQIRHGLFTTAPSAEPVETRHARYDVHQCSGSTVEALSLEVQNQMARLEGLCAAGASESELVVLDGPLRGREFAAGALGYVKTHRTAYLPPDLQGVLAGLGPGQRTPVFLLESGGWTRFSWYLRLPSQSLAAATGSPLSGTVRCELAPDAVTVTEAAATADLAAATLVRFASREYNEPRAPQNLYPIAGLEKALRRRLGDPRLLYRSLRAAAARNMHQVAP